jgi:hypothetical protein
VFRAGCRKPPRRKQERGPQHQVKPAASKEKQSESRAAHVTAKATPIAPAPERATDLGGVEGAARVRGGVRNTRGPSAQPVSGQGGSYEPKAKSSAAQRESEGPVVPSIAAQKNAAGGKGPWDGRVAGAGKREGMAGRSGPNHPDRREPIDKVRQLQRRLCVAAKRHPGRRLDALKTDVEEAEKRVRIVLAQLGLELHPDETRKVDLSWGREGFDFLGSVDDYVWSRLRTLRVKRAHARFERES